MMHIVFATNNNFCQHAAVAIASLLDNNKGEDITLHLFIIDCEQTNLDNIKLVADSFSTEIKFYPVSEKLFEKFSEPGVYSWACYLRLLAPSLLPNIDKVLYLDVDIVVNGNIRNLWEEDITGYSLAGLNDAILSYNLVKDYIGYDYYKEGYINSGVLLMNLDYWRKNNIQQKMIDYLNTHKVKLSDQDTINALLHSTIKFLHPEWNTISSYFTFPPLVIPKQKKYIKELWKGAKIIHFVGPYKQWHQECVNPYKRYYRHIPFLHHEELAKVYREHDLFVFPSYLDSWAMVVLEAMASGTPVIVTENTGAKDAVTKGGGKIIPVDDIEALKSAISYYYANRNKIKEDGIIANRVAQNYTWDSYYEQINQIISSIKTECSGN
jgi:lipopolysaccharide biosynthesis glycosyltransferase